MFTVEKHIRGKWVCRQCERLIQKPVPPHVIDKGIPTAGLLAQVLVAKYLDHAPLYRQESIFERAGLALSRSTLAEWVGACGVRLQPLVEAMKEHLLKCPVLHADETPVPMLKPGLGRTHRAYLWSYSSSEYDDLQAVIYDFADGRGGAHAQAFLGDWTGKLVCDDYAGYKALFNLGIIEVGCMAHARRKLHDLYADHRGEIAEEGLRCFAALYEIEREGRELKLDTDGRRLLRQQDQARRRSLAAMAHSTTRPGAGWLRHKKSDRLQPRTLGGADPLSRRWRSLPIDSNHHRELNTASGPGQIELALCRIPSRRAARREHHEPHPVREAQRTRSVSLPQGRP